MCGYWLSGRIWLAKMFAICSYLRMARIDEHAVAAVMLEAPGWARVGLSAPKEWLREDAALELARVILSELGPDFTEVTEQGQLPL
tara:strand:+ start:407 stop:664 length:258 start_codon:yes stop_codon:yes gene_type:complete